MKLPTIFRKLSETRKVVKDARSLCRNDVADLKGHGFEPHLRPGKLFACKKFFPLKILNPNLLRYVLCTPSGALVKYQKKIAVIETTISLATLP